MKQSSDMAEYAHFCVIAVDHEDGSVTNLGYFHSSGEARNFLLQYINREDAGGWQELVVEDIRGECAEILWNWRRDN